MAILLTGNMLAGKRNTYQSSVPPITIILEMLRITESYKPHGLYVYVELATFGLGCKILLWLTFVVYFRSFLFSCFDFVCFFVCGMSIDFIITCTILKNMLQGA